MFRLRADSIVTERGSVLCLAAIIAGLVLAGPGAAQQTAATRTSKFSIVSASFEADGTIPTKYSCAGENVSPALEWKNPPDGTQAFALIVDDPDNPKKTIVHWVIYNLPAAARTLPEAVPDKAKLPDGSMQGKNEDGKSRYRGPCPPDGPAHHYFFKLYALDAAVGLKPKATAAELEGAMKGHILVQAQLIGRFQK
ncbi:MAG: YbhB/YbcL family Raf kinase inhibitor-like protein [Candidatus Acidiferrales bacterium]